MLTLLFNQRADVTVSAAGVGANAAIGAGQIDVTFALASVAASAAIGNGSIDVTFALTGIAASAAIGSGSIDVTFALTGIAANSAIGTGSVAIDFTAAGVSASAATGAGPFDVDLVLFGVAGAAAIGTGTLQGAVDVVVGCTLAAATVLLGATLSRRKIDHGVKANARIGVGYVLVDVDIRESSPKSARLPEKKLGKVHPQAGRVICDVVFSSPGCHAPAIVSNGRLISDVVIRQPKPIKLIGSKIGRGKIVSVVDLTDDEICALLAMAA